MKKTIALLGSALVLLCAPAMAQSYVAAYDGPRDDVRYVDERPTETVIVRPDYDYVEKRQLIGNYNGERNPTAYTVSRPVGYSDLNLADASDRRELRARIHDTAEQLCSQLDGRFPELAGDRSADRECIRNATRTAMRDALEGV